MRRALIALALALLAAPIFAEGKVSRRQEKADIRAAELEGGLKGVQVLHESLDSYREDPACAVRIAGRGVLTGSRSRMFGGKVTVPSVVPAVAASGSVEGSSGKVKMRGLVVEWAVDCAADPVLSRESSNTEKVPKE